MIGGRTLGKAVLVLAVVGAGGNAAPALGDHSVNVPNLSSALPPSQNSPGVVPLGFDACPRGQSRCPRNVVGQMTRRWQPLDRSCDHRAVFALTYLRTTEEFVRTLQGDPGFFEDGRWVRHEDVVFAQLYFNAFDDYAAGRPVPGAWRVAFDAAKSPDETAIGDLLLGMNAHIQRDLPFTLAHVGLVKPNGSARKTDHDRVNAFLDRVVDPVQDELARRYDQLFATTDAKPSPADELSALQGVRLMREGAWRNAERLVNAGTADERRQVADSIELYAESSARAIAAANTLPGYGATRDGYCRAASG